MAGRPRAGASVAEDQSADLNTNIRPLRNNCKLELQRVCLPLAPYVSTLLTPTNHTHTDTHD